MDMAGAAITMVSVLSERRLNRLTNPALSQGLPDFLAHEPGFYSGMMLSQYTADTLIVEQRMLSAPASTLSIPAAAKPGIYQRMRARYLRSVRKPHVLLPPVH